MKTIADFFGQASNRKRKRGTPPTPATPSTPSTPQTPRPSNQSSPSTPPSPAKHHSTPSTPHTPPSKKHTQQLYLDFGQASFGSRTICPTCNTLIVHGLLEDESQHIKICNEYKMGVPFEFQTARIVHQEIQNKGYVVEIRPKDCIKWRRKVMRVKEIVDQELGFVSNEKDSQADMNVHRNSDKPIDSKECWGDKTIFLHIVEKRVVGFCAVQVISKGYHLLVQNINPDSSCLLTRSSLKNDSYSRSTQPTKAVMGVHQLWTHKSHRQKHIARTLVDAARGKLIFGMTVPHHLVAFSSPTVDGALFAKKYSFPDAPLVYDF